MHLLIAVLFLLTSSLTAQQNKHTPEEVNTKSADILNAIMQSHNHHGTPDSGRTISAVRILENGFVLESQLGQYWDGSTWVNASNNLYTYNPEGQKIEEIDQNWNNGQWENSRRFLTTYFLNDLISRYEEMQWTGSDWQDSYEYVSLYNSSNQLSEYDVQQWNGASWDSLYKSTYSYTASGNLETEIDMTYNGTGWDNNYRYTYQFNTSDNASQKLEEQWMGGEWKNSILDVYTYNAQEQLELDASFWWPDTAWKESVELWYGYNTDGYVNDLLTKFWESEELGLQNKFHVTYEYIPGTDIKTKVENQEWLLQTSEWTNTWREVYTFDGDHILQNHASEVWTGNDWGPGSQDDYTYDTDGNLDEILSLYWDGTEWLNSFKASFTWSPLTSVDPGSYAAVPASYKLDQNYPNPFNPATVIRYTVPKDGNVKLTVYNVIGQKITGLINREVKAGTYEVNFDASQLPSGIYMYKLEAGTFTSVRKMMLIK